MKPFYVLALCLLCLTANCQSLQELYTASKKSYEERNFTSFLKLTKKLDSLRPSHPAFTYNLAVAYAAVNAKEEAFKNLRKAILMNNKIEFETAEEFLGFQETEEFKQLVQLKQELDKTVVSAEKKISLSEKDLHPEGLAFLPKSKIWLAGSIHKRKIVRFDPETGKCTDWLKTGDMLAVFAIKPDRDERFLWAATSAMPEMLGFSGELDGNAEVLKIEIATRKIVKRFTLSGKHVFGDLAVSNSNEVFISDSANPIIYTVKKGGLSVWLDLQNQAHNLQGLSFNSDFSTLYAADYLKGILHIPMARPSGFKWLAFPENTTSKGIDGLVFYNNSLIAVHNGVNPIRIIRYDLDNKNEISGYKILDISRPEFDEPALATIVGNELYFFANAPWKAYDKSFALNQNAFENPILFRNILK